MKKNISDSEGQGFHQEQSDKGRTSRTLMYLDRILGRWEGYFDKLLNGENHRLDSDRVPNDGLTQRIGRNEVLKSNVITNEERSDNGNGWDSRRCVDVFGRRRD